ncbi:hypothetical protein RhiirA5_382346 [Rhizophagus irregularis]|uniref:Uncharacterized protein n=1 Tax=Rhizophagus irregularis TaxID=588596 RepID=A0A2N0RD60_9GLOM|nr:hypothetical protein RhiirA5_382346 [Rhizophagus irregularis]PKC61244.1 hypothetical protein RhiirA1_398566 [Rhizophagus irregularis]
MYVCKENENDKYRSDDHSMKWFQKQEEQEVTVHNKQCITLSRLRGKVVYLYDTINDKWSIKFLIGLDGKKVIIFGGKGNTMNTTMKSEKLNQLKFYLVLLTGHVTRPDLKAQVGFNNFYDPMTRMTRPG